MVRGERTGGEGEGSVGGVEEWVKVRLINKENKNKQTERKQEHSNVMNRKRRNWNKRGTWKQVEEVNVEKKEG